MGSIKKHITQMTELEKQFLWGEIKKVEKWSVSYHLRERMRERGGSKNLILELINTGTLIEYHQRNGKSRVLIRGSKIYKRDVLCAVFQFERSTIITLYWNRHNDHHKTLKEEAYNENVDILRLFTEEAQQVKRSP